MKAAGKGCDDRCSKESEQIFAKAGGREWFMAPDKEAARGDNVVYMALSHFFVPF